MRRPAFAPDRLVSITSPCNIHLSESHSEMVDYVALSYCWGTSTVLKTTKLNLSDHLTLIPWSVVPKTFQQAIDLTLMLGYEYIWIDSLCIIQQDAEDFAEQSSQMGNIYTSAALVISADSGQGVEAGFLKERFYASTTIRIPTWKRQAHSTDRVFAKPIPYVVKDSDGINYDERDDHTSFHSDPTFTRAWCFQEQLMATRIVHFTTNEMYWACASQLTCECKRLASTVSENDPQLLQRYFNALEPTSGQTRSPPSAVDFWWSLVESFSRRRLTRVTDRLPAMSGLAKLMHRHFSNLESTSCERSKVHNIVNSWGSRVKRVSKHRPVSVTDRPVPAIPGLAKVTYSEDLGDYHAGLWERQLPIALLWRTDDLVDPEDYPWKPLEYIGPTWSWISIMGIVQGPEWADDRKPVAKVVKVDCVRSSADRYGTVASASITITAPAMTDILQHKFTEYTGGTILRSAGLASGLQNAFLDLRPNRNPDEDSSPYLGEVLCMRIAKRESEISEGLILTKSKKLKGAYERIGTLTMYRRREGWWKRRTVTII